MDHSAGHDIDPTFYRSPADAISAPPEQLAYVVVFDRAAQQPDALAVLDTDPASAQYVQVGGCADLPTRGDELHHFGWNAGSSAFAHAGHHTFDGLRALETDRGDQYLAYGAWWHRNQNTPITSEWGTPSMIEDGVNPELLLGQKYGHPLHFWDLAAGKLQQTVDLGAQHQM